MDNILFNPIKNKHPRGAIKTNETVNFELLVKKNIHFKDLKLIIHDEFRNSNIIKTLNYQTQLNEFNYFTVSIDPLPFGVYFYYFEIIFDDCSYFIKSDKLNSKVTKDKDRYSKWQLTVYKEDFSTPEWFKGTIMYQIFPDRFFKSSNFIPGDVKNYSERIIHKDWNSIPHSGITHNNYQAKDFFMGNLLGIEEKKQYFNNLNIETIYLNPIVESAENHRYSTADYFNVDPFFGTNEQFKNFCIDFKKDNINIILDGVFSHTGSDSIYFNKENNYNSIGAYNSKDSNYFDWYFFKNYPNEYHSWWGFNNLPTVNKRNKNFIKFINEKDNGVLNFWQKLGISGWRLDVADEFTDEFLDEIRYSCKNFDKDSLIIGEVWEDATNKISYDKRRRYFLGDQLDSVMNYPWKDAIINFVKYHDVEEFSFEILSLVENYPKPALDSLMNLLSSHDTERIITMLALDDPNEIPVEKRPTYKLSNEEYSKATSLLKFAAFLQFTLPGVPSIYYGDEIGMYGFRDPYNRLGFTWNNIDNNLLEFYKNLSKFRFDNKNSFKNSFELIYSKDKCIAYKRNNILCIINMSEEAKLIPTDFKLNNILFSNSEVDFSKYGIVVSSKSYSAIEIDKL